MKINKFEKLQHQFLDKKFISVIKSCKKLLKKLPKEIYLYNMCGLSLQFCNRDIEAILYFKKALEIDNKNYVVKVNLANSFKNLNKYKEAEKNYIEAISSQSNNPTFLSYYAIFKSHLLQNKEAVELFKSALKHSSNNLNIMSNLAVVYQKIGDFNNSKILCEKILKLNPNFLKAHIIINSFTDYKNDKNHLKKLLELNLIKKINFKDKASINFALGKAFDDKKVYDKAFSYFKEANNLINKNNNCNLANNKKLFKSIKNIIFKNKKIENDKQKKIIFIVGLPRSGTTLVEQILSSHENISAAGELNYLENTIHDLFIKKNKIIEQKFMKEINSSDNNLKKRYYNLLDSYNFKTKYITDKTPLNFKWIGFIKSFFPESKIIICNRNNNDIFVSIFKNNFTSQDMNWAFDKNNIKQFIDLYDDLINYFKNLYGNSIFNLSYENLITNSEFEIKNLIKFCGLKWDKKCLNPHKNFKSSISTASSFQARNPIYTSSLRTSNFYDKYLNKYFN